MKTIKIFALLFVIIFIAQSCREDSNDFTIIPPITVPEISVIASVIGTVLDDNGEAVESAAVIFEDQIIFTDENGIFQYHDEALFSSGTYIKVEKDGFFAGSRKFYASEGKTSIVSIELIPNQKVAEFSNAEGGGLTFENVELDFKANSIMIKDGSAYSGNVNVAAKYLDPTLLNTLNQMPGDLTGITTDQNRVVLTSMSMFAVELFDDNGNALQIRDGNIVDVKIPVPSSLLNDAPSTIPMWYFDEEIGTWIEEGSAELRNGMYEASLSHFTFWNCDIPNNLVFLKGSVVNRGIPIQGVNVKVTLASGGTSASTITDANGFFCGYVPKGEDLNLDVFDQCGNVIYSINISASEIDINLDPFNLFIETNMATVSGSVALCYGEASPQTYISVRQGLKNNIIVINDDLTFSANISFCDNISDLLVRAVDPVNVLASETLTFSIDDIIDIGEIELCDKDILVDERDGEKYLTVEINGKMWTAENMRYDTDDAISNGYDITFSSVPEHYGRYYNFHSAQSACPNGWHLPSKEEYEDLIDYFSSGTSENALKSTEGWIDNENGTNSSGFNAFPAGRVVQSILKQVGSSANFWSSTKESSAGEWLILNSGSDAKVGLAIFELGTCVRCLQD